MMKVLITYDNGSTKELKVTADAIPIGTYAAVCESPVFSVSSIEILSYDPNG